MNSMLVGLLKSESTSKIAFIFSLSFILYYQQKKLSQNINWKLYIFQVSEFDMFGSNLILSIMLERSKECIVLFINVTDLFIYL